MGPRFLRILYKGVSRAKILPLFLSKKLTRFLGDQGDSYRPAVEKSKCIMTDGVQRASRGRIF